MPTDMPMTPWRRENPPDITQIVKSDGVIYAKGRSLSSVSIEVAGKSETRIFRVSTDGNKLVTIQDIPIFDSRIRHLLTQRKLDLSDKLFVEQLKENASGAL